MIDRRDTQLWHRTMTTTETVTKSNSEFIFAAEEQQMASPVRMENEKYQLHTVMTRNKEKLIVTSKQSKQKPYEPLIKYKSST